MFRTKAEVDRHVLAKSAKFSDRERAARSYSFAQLYFGVGDYETCRRYVCNYLSASENNAAAHTLLGSTLLKLGHKEKALDEFKISYELDSSQKNLLFTVCELLADKDVLMDVTRAKHWYQLAEVVNPHHPAVFQLKERVISTTGADPTSLEKLLEVEMKTRPDDVALHARYLRQLLTMNKVTEAFNKSLQLELKKDEKFRLSFIWYETLMDVLNHNKLPSLVTDWEHNLLRLIVLEKICSLTLLESASNPRKSMSECLTALHNLDQALFSAQGIRGLPELVKEILTYFKGQISFHIATCILKKAKRELIIWRDAVKSSAPFLLIAFHARPPEEKPSWLSQAPDHVSPLLLRWKKEASYRCSQAGHVLQGCIKENRRQLFLDEINQTCTNPQWNHKVYSELFANKDELSKIKTSYLIQSLENPNLRLPRLPEINLYDETAQSMHPDSLHHLVWLGLNYSLPELHCTVFNTLPYTVQNFSNCSPESLSQMDVDAFLYSSILTAQQKISYQNNTDYKSNDKPSLLPANISELLCTVMQMKWWECAYSLHVERNLEDVGDKKSLLIRGIEVVRCIGDHGMPSTLLCTLGSIFSDRANTSKDHKSSLDDWAALYYITALPLLEEAKSRTLKSHYQAKKKMFDYVAKELSSHAIDSLLEETKLFLGIRYMNDGANEKAAEMLSSVNSPYGSYHLFFIYKRLSDEQVNFNKENITSEMRSKRITLLSKARQAAYMTMDRIKNITNAPKKHPLYSDVTEQLQNIELKLCRIDPDVSNFNRNECDGKYSSDDDSSKASFGEHIGSVAMPHNNSLYVNASSTPKYKAYSDLNSTVNKTIASSNYNSKKDPRITSDRMDYYIKQLQKKDSLMACFIDQTREWFDTNRDLAEEVRDIKRTVANMKSGNFQDTLDQFNTLKISMDQIRDRMTDHRNESKSEVKDLRREINELKKDISKGKEAPSKRDANRDICFIEDNQNNLDQTQTFPNAASQLPFSPHQPVIPGFSQRIGMPPVNVPPTGSFNPFSMQNQLFLYNQYPHLAQFPPFFDGSRPIFPGHSNLFPGDQLYPDISQLLGPNNIPAPIISQAPPVPPPSIPTTVMNVRSTPLQPVSQPQPNTVIEPSKPLPLNVVITSSDPLPTRITVPQPTLSVTIPPEHIKGNIPHNYQIPLPLTTVKTLQNANLSSVSTPKLGMNNITTMVASFGSPKMSTPTVNSIFGTPSNLSGFFDTPKSKDLSNMSANADKSRTLSEKSNVSIEYDPCPDFKPIIPLPDEVEINTGEEDEIQLFKSRAKLFRFRDKQWKDRGIGDVKLLKNKVTGKVRLLMRREQIHKICANHIITADTQLQPMKGQDKAYFWVANDFADEVIVLEKFCIRFKTVDLARDFYDVFEKARLEEKDSFRKDDSGKTSLSTSQSFGGRFKPKLGSWTCDSCYLNNDSSKSTCIACNTAKESAKPNLVSEKLSSKPNLETQNTSENAATTRSIFETKPVLGGLTFSSTPTFKPMSKLETTENDPKTQKPTVNPFASFTFAPATTQVASFPATGFTTIQNTGFKPTPFAGASPNKVSQKQEQNEQLNVSSSSDHVEDFTPTAEFKPVIPLPKLVDIKTGEENEEVLFEHRAKLLRFDSNTKEWKERGLGNIKLLKNTENQKLRLLMRRELIFKVCCNHFVTDDMEFNVMPNLETALTWCAPDFSENEVDTSTFCLRFKTSIICKDFLNAIKNARENLSEKLKTLAKKPEKTASSGFGDQFKPKAGSWSCTMCLVNNDASAYKCVSCSTSRELESKSEKKSSIMTTKGFGDKFKPKPGAWVCSVCCVTNDATTSKCVACSSLNPNVADVTQHISQIDSYWDCLSCKMKNDNSKTTCIVCNVTKGEKIPSIVPKFSFGIPTNSAQTTTPFTSSISKKDVQPTFSFGTPNSGTGLKLSTTETKVPFSWTGPSTNGPPVSFVQSGVVQNETTIPTWNVIQKISETGLVTPTKQEDGSVSFAVNRTSQFGFQMSQKSPGKSPKVDQAGDSDNEYAVEEEDNTHFTPVIPLPDKVEVITGEEDEEVLSVHRAKLFRFANGEFKERGIGDIKILRHKKSKKLRVLMRREHVLKICLNHALTKDVNYTPKNEKTWLFSAFDFSEGQVELPQQFCLKFKSKEIAEDFKKSADSARGETPKPRVAEQPTELQIVAEIKPDQGDIEAARKLKLPDNFFNYKNKEKCKGCRGCDDQNFEFPSVDLAELDRIHGDYSSTDETTERQKQAKKVGSKKKDQSSTPVKTVEFKIGDVIESTTAEIACGSTPNFRLKPIETEVFSTPQGAFGTTPNEKPFTNIFAVKNAELNASNIFSPNKSQNIFGYVPKTSTDNKSTVPHFSLSPSKLGTTSKPESSKIAVNLFSQPSSTETQPKKNVFGFSALKENKVEDNSCQTKDKENESVDTNISNKSITNKNIFGTNVIGEPTNKAFETGSIFSQTNTETTPATTASIFGSSGSSIFGSNSFAFGKPVAASGNTNLFGNSAPMTTIFGKNSTVNGSLFSQTPASSVFAPKLVQNSTTESQTVIAKSDDATESFESKPMFNVDNDLLFSSLAANSDSSATFAKTENFEWEGAGQKLFTPSDESKAKNGSDHESGDEDKKDKVEKEHDPHFEPIVPLPDEIDVKTGEEEEQVLFCERGKLYRYDDESKQWKERGVGNIKILHHEERDTYRILLRRDQVHKVVLNQLVTPDLKIIPLTSSDRAWSWAGRNHAESDIGDMEKLAVRFKLQETSEKFKDVVEKTVATLASKKKDNSAKKKVSIMNTPEEVFQQDVNESPTYTDQFAAAETLEIAGEEYYVTHDDDDDDQEHDDYEDYENDDGSLMFSVTCDVAYINEKLSIKDALLQVVYDSELFLGKIIITDTDGLIHTNMLVLSECDINMTGTTCEWSGSDNASLNKDEKQPEMIARNRTIKAVFKNDDDTLTFYNTYMECITFCKESFITEGDHQHDIGAEED